MGRRKKGKFLKLLGTHYRNFTTEHGQDVMEFFQLPFKIVFLPITLAFDIAGSAQRGFGIPELMSKLSAATVFGVATLGTYDIALDIGRKVTRPRNCRTCLGWQALQCTMCRGSGKVHYQVKYYTSKSGERATAERVADAIVENRAELVHLPSIVDLHAPLPSKDCPSCDGTGAMRCPTCKDRFPLTFTTDDIVEPPWKAYNIMTKMHYPYEHIAHSMKDPSIAAFWLISMPQIVGGFNFDEEIKQKIWWQYLESMRYDRVRDTVAERGPGWENLQEALVTLDPARAKDDPVIVKNIPYYQARKTVEAEVMKLEPPARPQNWGDMSLPLDESCWSEEDLKDPKKSDEMTVLLNAQKEMASKFLDAQWEAKWREEKVNQVLEEKVQPYIQNTEGSSLSEPIVIRTQNSEFTNVSSELNHQNQSSKFNSTYLLAIAPRRPYQTLAQLVMALQPRWYGFTAFPGRQL
ncbi:hypothetical protein V2J09_007704 [Rumex salicifolius]